MDEQKQQEDRWRELGALLGVPEDAPAPSKEEKPAELPLELPAIKAYEEPPHLVAHHPDPASPAIEDDVPPSIPMMREESEKNWETEFEEEEVPFEEQPTVPLIDVQPAVEEDQSNEEASESPPTASDEEGKPRRGRRRRRRGKRRGNKGEGETPRSDEAVPPKPSRGEESESREKRHGKRRDAEDSHRRAPRPEPEAEVGEADEVFENEPRRASVAHDDTDFSDWNVPSWQELISALYRPDRDR